MSVSVVKLAQQLDDALSRHSELPLQVEGGKGLDELYELRSLISDCIVAIELKEERIR